MYNTNMQIKVMNQAVKSSDIMIYKYAIVILRIRVTIVVVDQKKKKRKN